MTRAAYYVFRRKAGKKKPSYYIGLLQPDGKYLPRALRDEAGHPITRKKDADERAALVWQAEVMPRGVLLSRYLSGFWAEGSRYLKKKAAAKEPLSAIYVINARSAIKKYVAPWLATAYPALTLPGVRPGHLEDLKEHLVDLGLGPSRVNGILKAVRVPLGEAWRREDIPSNPASKVRKLPDAPPKRKILEVAEARAFFAQPWRDARMYAANLTAALAGLRLGEIRGLQAEDIVETRRGKVVEYHLHVCHNWQDWEAEGAKMKGPKHHTEARPKYRDVPIHPTLATALRDLAARNPYGDGFVFCGHSKGEPPSSTLVEESYREGLAAVGIKEKERKARHLTFHAWRHFFNSHVRGAGLPDYQLRLLTGHSDGAMTDRYTEITDEQRAAVAQVAGRLLE